MAQEIVDFIRQHQLLVFHASLPQPSHQLHGLMEPNVPVIVAVMG